MTTKRSDIETCAVVLERAKNSDVLKWHLINVAEVSHNSFNHLLHTLLEARLLIADETNLRICQTGELRNVVFKTTNKGNYFLQKVNYLQTLLEGNE